MFTLLERSTRLEPRCLKESSLASHSNELSVNLTVTLCCYYSSSSHLIEIFSRSVCCICEIFSYFFDIQILRLLEFLISVWMWIFSIGVVYSLLYEIRIMCSNLKFLTVFLFFFLDVIYSWIPLDPFQIYGLLK